MVVGCYQYVETRFTDGGKIFVWCTESRIATIWFSAEGYFQIGDGNIRPADFFFDEFETIGVIVSGRSTGGIDLSLVLHQVTGKRSVMRWGRRLSFALDMIVSETALTVSPFSCDTDVQERREVREL